MIGTAQAALPALEERNTGAALTGKTLDQLAKRLDGKPAAPNTIARRKAVFYNVLEFGVEQGILSANPIDYLSWTAPKAVGTVDRRSVVNIVQGRKLLSAVAEWAGHSVAVLLKVYAKCIVGQDKAARDRIAEALKQPEQGENA